MVFGDFCGSEDQNRKNRISSTVTGGWAGTSWWSLFKKCKKVGQKWSKVLKTGRNSIFGVQMGLWCGFFDLRGSFPIYCLLHVF